MKRFFYVWIGMLGFAVVAIGWAVVLGKIAAVVSEYTNAWIGGIAMLVLSTAVVAWWMACPPRWMNWLVKKMSDIHG